MGNFRQRYRRIFSANALWVKSNLHLPLPSDRRSYWDFCSRGKAKSSLITATAAAAARVYKKQRSFGTFVYDFKGENEIGFN